MALTSTLGSPGIEIREIDNSVRIDSSTSTTVFVPGFAAQGPVEEVMSIGSIEDFELIYGKPTNGAERYFYYTVKALLDKGGSGCRVLTSRLPYGEGLGDAVSDAYTLLAYPAVPVIKTENSKGADCYLFDTENLSEIFSIKAEGVNAIKCSDIDSSYDIFIEEDYLSENFDNWENTALSFGMKKCVLPAITHTATPEESPKISISSKTLRDTGIKFDTSGTIVTEFSGGKLIVNLSYTILEGIDVTGGETKSLAETTKKIGQAHFRLVFLQDVTNNLTSASDVDKFSLQEVVDATLNFTPAFEIAASLDGQSKEQLGKYKAETDKYIEVKIGENTYTVYTRSETGTKVGYRKATADEIADDESILYIQSEVTDESDADDIVYEKLEEQYIPAGNEGRDLFIQKDYVKYTQVTEREEGKTYYIEDENITEYVYNPVIKYEIKEITDSSEYTNDIKSIVYDEMRDSAKFSKDVTYLIGAPATFQVSLKDYYNIITGEFINWSRRPYSFTDEETTVYENSLDKDGSESKFGLLEAIGHSAFITINTSRTCVNENFEGYYMGLTDNMFVTPSDDYIFNAVTGVKITTDTYLTKNANIDEETSPIGLIDSVDPTNTDYSTLGTQRLTFKLDSNNQGSMSRVMTRDITSKDISSTDFDDTLSMGLFRLSKTTDSNDVLKLNYSLREKYNWSFSKNRLKSEATSTKPVSYYAENIMESSPNITIMINPYISNKDFMSFDGVFHGKMRVFGDKLVGTLDKFEDKYLRRTYTYAAKDDKNTSLLMSHKLAKNNIDSYKTMISQAGVSPYLLRTSFRSSITEGVKTNYKTFAPINSIYPFGVYTTTTTSRKVIGQVPSKLQRALTLVENDEQYPDIDLLVEGGLGTIYMNSNGNEMSGEYASRNLITSEGSQDSTNAEQSKKQLTFDETVILTGVEDMRTSRTSLSEDAQNVLEDYLAVSNVFLQFANSMQNGGRGDTFYISDIPRGILIKGKDTKITNLYGVEIENNAYDFGESVVHSFPTSIYYPIKHQFDTIVSTYASVYAQWVKIYDDATGEKVWIPVSGHIAANMASTDAVYGPWYASAGLRRGVVSGVLDYALSPTISQRTDLYKICINSVPKIPNYGVTIWGIRTMSKKDSAFDQNTCRRTFLYMEKKIKQLLRYYLFEPNNSYTRLQIYNDIDPFLEGIKNNGGIYSYTLVCDTTVNTPEIINNGDLVVAIAAAPTRTAENIIVEFTANKYTEEISAMEEMK